MDAPIITDNAYELLGLNRNGLQCLNMLLLLPYLATIATSIGLYTDPLYDPEAGKSWWDKHFVQIFFAAMQILAGIAMMMSGVGSGAGVLMIVSGGMNVLSAALGSELVGAAS